MCLFKKNESAVSPIIGVLLMVAITVMVAALVAVFGFGFGATTSKPPVSAITAVNIPETTGTVDMRITYRGGDSLKAGQWELSIVPVGQPPVYRAASADFRAGDMIITTNITSGAGNYIVTNSSVTCSSCSSINLTADGKYEVKIVVYPFKSMALDTVVEVR
jgi:flagellin-like protein